MRNLVTRTMLCIAILSIASPGVSLFAQQTPEQKAADEKKAAQEKKDAAAKEQQPPKVSEEMVVTARKREETVQTVPISVAAPTESELRDRGAENIEDVSANV